MGAHALTNTLNTSNATAIGYRSVVSQSDSLVLGSVAGLNEATATTKVGIGTAAPLARLDVRGDVYAGLTAGPAHTFGVTNSLYVANDGGDAKNSFRLDGSANNLYVVANSGAGAAAGTGIVFRTAAAAGGEADRLAVLTDGTVKLFNLGAAGSTQLCLNASNVISGCSSSARYKGHVRNFSEGLGLLRRLRPVTFDWTAGGGRDLGFVAEEVAGAEPLLATRNAAGEVEGVKYDRISAVLVNAVKEQQAEIEGQRRAISELREQNARMSARLLALERRPRGASRRRRTGGR